MGLPQIVIGISINLLTLKLVAKSFDQNQKWHSNTKQTKVTHRFKVRDPKNKKMYHLFHDIFRFCDFNSLRTDSRGNTMRESARRLGYDF